MKTTALLAGAIALVLTGGMAMAQTKQAAAKSRSAQSIACSKQADAKGLHGKERKTFRAKCKKDMGKKAA